MVGERVELIARHVAADEMTAYERLLGDAIRGDATLFVRQDTVEAAWAVVEPIVGTSTPPHEYEPNTWGPVEADRIIDANIGWHNPASLTVGVEDTRVIRESETFRNEPQAFTLKA
jgi:glucose-6-phosphate 1-dehydrogenase